MSITEFVQQTAATTQVCVETLVSDGRIISWRSATEGASEPARAEADGVGRTLLMPLESRRAATRRQDAERPRPVWFFLDDSTAPCGAA